MIPVHLLSACADRMDVPCFGCSEAVKRNAETGRFFITMGHPGFNCARNNGRGWKHRAAALKEIAKYRR